MKTVKPSMRPHIYRVNFSLADLPQADNKSSLGKLHFMEMKWFSL